MHLWPQEIHVFYYLYWFLPPLLIFDSIYFLAILFLCLKATPYHTLPIMDTHPNPHFRYVERWFSFRQKPYHFCSLHHLPASSDLTHLLKNYSGWANSNCVHNCYHHHHYPNHYHNLSHCLKMNLHHPQTLHFNCDGVTLSCFDLLTTVFHLPSFESPVQ